MKTNVTGKDPTRGDRLIQEHLHDPYKTTSKLPEPTVCPRCNAVFAGGHWQWKESWPLDSHKELCHACRRIRDDYPAGLVTLRGAFVASHKEELLHLARNQEKAENTEHPMHRIMKVEESAHEVVINTTDLHLPKRIGDALRHAYKGTLETHYDQDGHLIRMIWTREE